MSLLQSAPRFSPIEAIQIAQRLYNLTVSATLLPSERDQNFHLITPDGQQFVLKIANASEDGAMLEAQNLALQQVSRRQGGGRQGPCPQGLPSRNGKMLESIQGRGDQTHAVRLLTWLPGKPLGMVNHPSDRLLQDVGRVMGEVDQALAGFDHPAAHRDFHWDVASAARVIRQHKDKIANPDRRALVEGFLDRLLRRPVGDWSPLRRAVIHGDANDYNLLVDPGDLKDPWTRYQRITGLLDFGDMVYSYLVCEPAIAAAYALLDKEEPLAALAAVVRGYHAVYPLSEAEMSVFFDLVCARLCMSVCHSVDQRAQRPTDEYLSISERPAWDALEKLAKIHPTFALCVVRHACGLEPHPNTAKITHYLRSRAYQFADVTDYSPATTPYVHVDWSIGTPMLGSAELGFNTEQMTRHLFAWVAANGEAGKPNVGFGGYNEARMIYAGEAFATGGSPTAERRTVHLGVDLFLASGEAIYAPLPGRVHSFHDNDERYDYGPVILLEHTTDEGIPFYTLYGHLCRESLLDLRVGKPIAAGERIGWIGAPPINGDWPPHLHFQIVVDHLGAGYDFNGVARASERAIWLSLCPDPNLILQIPPDRFPAQAPAKAETLRDRKARIGRNLSISYRQPLKIVRGLKQYLYDDTGRAYLDGVNNVCHVGHCHPHVVKAGQRQMAVLNTNTRYLHDSINQLAERLCASLPEPLSVCFFVCSGTEANELALRLARAYTGQFDMICVDAGYHGHSQALIEVSPYKHNGDGGKGTPPWVQMAMMPDPYRGRYKGYSYESGRQYAEDVARAVAEIERAGRGVAGFICESMIGCGGQIVLPDGYMAEAFKHVRADGGLCIADEVQVGFGRAGSHFWGFETQGVIPDIVTMGKPIGNGHPLAAVVTTPEIADRFANGMEYFNTFGGNPVSCEIGLAVLDVIEQEQLQANALQVGNRIMEGARALMPNHRLIGDVRGLGLYIGIELVLDQETLEPAGEHASYISNRMKDHGILISTDGPYHNVLKIKPPIIWSERDADHLVRTLDRVLAEDALQVG